MAAETGLHVGMLAKKSLKVNSVRARSDAGPWYSNHLITFVLSSPAFNETCHL